MSLADVHHQGSAQQRIQRAVSRDRIPHAYLFHGPDGVGKEKLALGLAKFLLCEKPLDQELDARRAAAVGIDRLHDACGVCDACRFILAGTHPDLHVVFRQLNREHPEPEVRKRKALGIGVDVLRHFVIEKVGLTPTLKRAKVFILREADRMTEQAQNALLKTLEEPPGSTIIVLLAAATHRLLPTTLSRCQVVRFDALPTEFIRSRLDEARKDLPEEQTAWYARVSDGSLGRAMRCAEEKLFEVNERLIRSLITLTLPDNDASAETSSRGDWGKMWIDESKALGDLHRKRDPEISDTEAGRRGLKAIFELASTFYADLLRLRSGSSVSVVNARISSEFDAVQSIEVDRAIEAVNRLAEAERQLDLNTNTQLCVEVLINDLSEICRG